MRKVKDRNDLYGSRSAANCQMIPSILPSSAAWTRTGGLMNCSDQDGYPDHTSFG